MPGVLVVMIFVFFVGIVVGVLRIIDNYAVSGTHTLQSFFGLFECQPAFYELKPIQLDNPGAHIGAAPVLYKLCLEMVGGNGCQIDAKGQLTLRTTIRYGDGR